MSLRVFLAVILATPLLGFSAPGSPAEAQQFLRVGIEEVLTIADRAPSRASLVDRLRPVLEKHVSFSAMTRRAIGPGWRQLSAAQQQEAIKLFTTLVIRTYSAKFTIGEHPVINYLPAVTPAAGRVDAPTHSQYQGSRYNVIYRMEKDEGWRVTDVIIEGVSLVANYRSQFDSKFKTGGTEAVLSSLRESASRPQ